jgi:hypothetical protein
VFTNQSDFLKHRKQKHAQNVPHCKNFDKGARKYGNENDKLKHEDEMTNNNVKLNI